MKLYNVADMSGLFRILDGCRDNVVVETADGTTYGWHAQGQTVRSLLSGNNSLSLRFENKDDVGDVMRFLMECRRSRHAA